MWKSFTIECNTLKNSNNFRKSLDLLMDHADIVGHDDKLQEGKHNKNQKLLSQLSQIKSFLNIDEYMRMGVLYPFQTCQK